MRRNKLCYCDSYYDIPCRANARYLFDRMSNDALIKVEKFRTLIFFRTIFIHSELSNVRACVRVWHVYVCVCVYHSVPSKF